MITTDTLSNFFSKIKNGYLANKSIIIQQKTKQIIKFLNIFIKEGLIKSYKISNENNNLIQIFLKYNNNSIFKNLKRISKPGKRVFIKNKDLFKIKKGLYIISTSKGLLTHIQAKKKNVGGELICIIFLI